MHANLRRGLYGALFAGGLLVLGAGAASATDQHSSGQYGILSGNQSAASVTAPVTVSGNALSVVGDSTANGSTTAVGTGNGAP
ncbi:chaplin family protein, partial [Sinomonas notoginsengisoli]